MAAKRIADCGLRLADWRWALAGMALVCGLASLVWADSNAERAARIASLPSDKKAELLRKKERFDKLTEPERQRLRDLHGELSSSADVATLETVMENYCNWLKNLQSSRERDEVLSLPTEDRIKRIKEIVNRQEVERLKDYVRFYLPTVDHDALYKFLDDFVKQHETDIFEQLNDDERRWVRRIENDAARRKALIPWLRGRYRDRMPFPSIEEMRQMASTLSPETQKQLGSQAGANRDERLRELVSAAIGNIHMPPPSEEDLRNFFAGLSSEEKGRLEEMDSDKMRRTLIFMYRANRIGGRMGPRGPRPMGPPPGALQGPALPGFANPKN
jgi:hypothetical protein